MSASRRRKKQLKRKQSTVRTVPHLPKAKRKGGRYVYPAGAYRQAMNPDPPAPFAPVLSPVLPALTPESEEPVRLQEPVVSVSDPAVTEQPETDTVIRQPLPVAKILPWGIAAALAVMAFALIPRSSVNSDTEGLTKLTPEPTEKSDAAITEAEAVPDLRLSVDPEMAKEPLESYFEEIGGEWAVYIKDLNTGAQFALHDVQMPSASLIKLFVAGTYLELSESGEIPVTERAEADLAAMISWSDNDAWQDLETCIGNGIYDHGIAAVNDFIERHGFEESGRLIGADSIYSVDAENYTKASEIGRVLDEIYHGTYVSEAASEKLLALMKDQRIITKIPAGLPEGIESANKTGELIGIENDAAIVYGRNTDYILVVMSNDNNIGTEPVAHVSSLVYSILNSSEEISEES